MSRDTKCTECRGTGQLGFHRGDEFEGEECHSCGGSGTNIECDGAGCNEILEPDHQRCPLFPGLDLCSDCELAMRMHKILPAGFRETA